jgi:diguanylate cyclase (GGDEF)-like protein
MSVLRFKHDMKLLSALCALCAFVALSVFVTLSASVERVVEQDTQKSALIWHHFYSSITLITIVACLAFALMSVLFYKRVREKQQADDHIQFLADHDPVSGLLNRSTFLDHLNAMTRRLPDSREALAVHFIDIDRFKDWNETLGHEGGDDLIRLMAKRISEVVPHHHVARIGPDQFVVIQRHITLNYHISDFARQLHDMLCQPFSINGREVIPSISTGIAQSPRDGRDGDLLLKCSDLALLQAKAAGGGIYLTFTPDMNDAHKERKMLEQLIREACLREQFQLYFQPVMNTQFQLSGFEALLRLIGPDGKHVPPAIFIPVAEEIGLINTIGSWVIRNACKMAVHWPPSLILAVNLSPLQFAKGDLNRIVKDALQESGFNPGRLEFEITETMLLKDTDNVLEQLRELKSSGISIAMDDFGTGYSSLSYFWRFPFDKIKIDRSFIQEWEKGDANMANILKTIIALGRSLSMTVTAEGVETQEQAQFLRGLQCDYLQGFYFGRPMPAQETTQVILQSLTGKAHEPIPIKRPPIHLTAV